ncbi:MAG: hypothetical protein IJ801_10240 [Lachnospiraceae bacterium]|nr:hypothetical protein [Lachnospiraceae bacterium]
MELMKANLLIFLVQISVIVFVIAYGRLSDSSFRQVFIFSRRQNVQYELRIAGRLMAEITTAGAALYALLCIVLKISGAPVWNLLLFPLAQLAFYLALSSAVWKNNAVGVLAVVVMLISVAPALCILTILIWKVKLDVYGGYFILFLLVTVFFLGKEAIHAWKKGDM